MFIHLKTPLEDYNPLSELSELCVSESRILWILERYHDAIPYVTSHLQWDLKSSDVQNKHLMQFRLRWLFAPQNN